MNNVITPIFQSNPTKHFNLSTPSANTFNATEFCFYIFFVNQLTTNVCVTCTFSIFLKSIHYKCLCDLYVSYSCLCRNCQRVSENLTEKCNSLCTVTQRNLTLGYILLQKCIYCVASSWHRVRGTSFSISQLVNDIVQCPKELTGVNIIIFILFTSV